MYLLLSDLDGTMFPLGRSPSSTALKKFKTILRENPSLKIGYMTGRSLSLLFKAIQEKKIPMPDVAVTDVGTKIYFRKSGEWKEDAEYKIILEKEWSQGTEARVFEQLREIKVLRPQENEKQARFKCSFYAKKTELKKALNSIRQRLKHKVRYTLIISKGLEKDFLIDILPPSASKRRSLEYLVRKLNLSSYQVLFAGDSFNDFSALTSNYPAVVVNNASQSLKRKVKTLAKKRRMTPRVYFAKGKYACGNGENIDGVIEALIHFGFLSKKRGLYIQLHSIHGLVDSKYSNLGRDEDTGGQIVYVIELAKELSKFKEIALVEVFTRLIEDSRFPNYSKKIEYIAPTARIVRIPFGGKKYLKKTKLWPYLEEYVDNVYSYCMREKRLPNIIHSHYADAGWAGIQLSLLFSKPQVHTAHSLGVPKMRKLNVGRKNVVQFNKIFHFSTRLAAEQAAIDNAKTIIASTKQERDEQYAGYKTTPSNFRIIPPGVDEKLFFPSRPAPSKKEKHRIKQLQELLEKNLEDTSKPMILAVSRMDRKKNVPALLKAFASNSRIWKNANLVILTGIRKKPDEEQKRVFGNLTSIIRKKPVLKKKVYLAKFICFDEGIAPLYRFAAKTRGVFVNPALVEPFGLTILEAEACGLPVVATKEGGPSQIIKHGVNGLLVDPKNIKNIADAILQVLERPKFWDELSKNGIHDIDLQYRWKTVATAHVKAYKTIVRQEELKKIGAAYYFICK
ncbi:MAG: HAD-IIB family hydrolase [Candidatus Micrarchaeia archaeon]